MRRHAGNSMGGRIDTILSLLQVTGLYKAYNETMLSMQTASSCDTDGKPNSDMHSQDIITTLLPVLMKEINGNSSSFNPDIIEKMKSILKGDTNNEPTMV